ncbi:RidA family protein [Salmonella enterica]|uniref:RidA family protein n=1 Tax=Enterobacteriaceae TaxID=543 RepID=UPI00071DC808|nr:MULTISPECIES: RidA family protein [Enterobacteriaceae]EBM9478511.1 RidA family protein [Salmonella enterica subsp. enterica serovar Rubislaw]EBV6531593.1 RidA family protein [Salmonella enterica subsp. enterica serovar Oranienburg]ECT6468326.1 RidA family protein [Salmonella enterica subsp. enterica serovar Senegal]EFD5185085.1 RidA family protein [Escherichia coli]EHC8527885.1 RidA family protein [Salmonella enterica subsp. enterica serovar 11:r:-]
MSIVRYPTTKPFPFSDAMQVNGFVFLSGHVAMNPEGEPLYGSVTQQTRHIMLAIRATLARAHTTLNNIVKVQVWLSSMEHFSEFNIAYSEFFPEGFPARSVVTSRLAFDLDVEIEVQAVV